MFCTPSDFNIPPYSIPNLNLVINTFQQYIDEHEAAILKKLLGVQFYNEAIAGHNALPPAWKNGPYNVGDRVLYLNDTYEAIQDHNNKPPNISPTFWLFIEHNIWADLGQGSTFTFTFSCSNIQGQSVQGEWLGIKDMLKPFIYYSWLRDSFDNYTGIGVVQANAENSTVERPARRLVDAYNEFSKKAVTMHEFIEWSNTPDVIYENYYPIYPGTINTFNL